MEIYKSPFEEEKLKESLSKEPRKSGTLLQNIYRPLILGEKVC